MIVRFLGDAFGVLSCQFWNTILQCGARLLIHTLTYWTVQSVMPSFLLGVCFNVALPIVDLWQFQDYHSLGMLYKIRCNHVHPLNDALPDPNVPVRVTGGALAHRYTYAPPRCVTSQYHSTFIPHSCSVPREQSCWPRIRWCVTYGFQEHGQCFFIDLSCSILTIVFYYFSLSLLSVCIGWCCEAGVFGLIGCISLSISLAMPAYFNNKINYSNLSICHCLTNGLICNSLA